VPSWAVAAAATATAAETFIDGETRQALWCFVSLLDRITGRHRADYCRGRGTSIGRPPRGTGTGRTGVERACRAAAPTDSGLICRRELTGYEGRRLGATKQTLSRVVAEMLWIWCIEHASHHIHVNIVTRICHLNFRILSRSKFLQLGLLVLCNAAKRMKGTYCLRFTARYILDLDTILQCCCWR